MPHHRDPGVNDRPHAGQHATGTLELDGVGAALLDEANGVAHRVLVGYLVRAERHVANHQRPAHRARYRAGHEQHLVHGHRDGRFVAEDHHGGAVADQEDVHAGGFGQSCASCVVRGHHRDPGTGALHLRQLRQRQLGGNLRLPGTGVAAGHPSPSLFRRTLSISRVDPTTTAAARVGPSRSAIAT